MSNVKQMLVNNTLDSGTFECSADILRDREREHFGAVVESLGIVLRRYVTNTADECRAVRDVFLSGEISDTASSK